MNTCQEISAWVVPSGRKDSSTMRLHTFLHTTSSWDQKELSWSKETKF